MPERPHDLILPTATHRAERANGRQTWDAVKERIEAMYGAAEPATMLPSVVQLQGEIGAARKTIEKALDRLLVEGFLTYRVTKGLTVTGLGHDEAIERSEMSHVLELRLAIEPAVARSAARAIKTRTARLNHVHEFRGAYSLLRDSFSGPSLRVAFSSDRGFHQSMFKLCDNPLLRAAVSRTNQWLMRNVEDVVSSLFNRPHYKSATEDQHDAIFEAIIRGDADAAHDAALEHLTYAHGQIINSLKRG